MPRFPYGGNERRRDSAEVTELVLAEPRMEQMAKSAFFLKLLPNYMQTCSQEPTTAGAVRQTLKKNS